MTVSDTHCLQNFMLKSIDTVNYIRRQICGSKKENKWKDVKSSVLIFTVTLRSDLLTAFQVFNVEMMQFYFGSQN